MNQTTDNTSSRQRVEPDFFPPGSKVCFICLSNQVFANTLSAIFENNGYLTTGTRDVETAIQKVRLNQYQAVVIEAGADFKTIFHEINSWPGNVRRDINLIVVGKKAPSMHQQMAFVMGANYYLNYSDAADMDKLIKQALDGFHEYYQPWNQAREVMDAN